MSEKYKVVFRIDGEVDGFIPKEGEMLIAFDFILNLHEQALEFLSSTFDINKNRIIITKIEQE